MSSYTEDNNQVPEMQQNLELLQELPFFASFPSQVMKLLALMAERIVFSEGENIFEAGDDHGRAYLILHGQLTLIKQPPAASVRHYYDGDFIGILSLLGSMPSLFTLQSGKETETLSIEREHFSKILEQFPETVQLSLTALAKEIHQWERKSLTTAKDCCLKLTGVTNL